MQGEQMIVVRNEYVSDEIAINEQNPETAIELIKADDITQGEYHKILNKSVWGVIVGRLQNVSRLLHAF